MKLTSHRYGKSRVRVMKVIRDGAIHTIKELTVGVMLGGDFERSFTSGENSLVIATDTMKNTVNVLAYHHLGPETESFALALADHFLAKYSQVDSVEIDISERTWDRLVIDGAPHPHTFLSSRGSRPSTAVSATRTERTVCSGVSDLLVLKSRESAFRGFPRDEFTTLVETDDRIFATEMAASWTWSSAPESYKRSNQNILAALLRPFAQNQSPSVQTTLFEMGQAALKACSEIGQIHLSMPNKHCLLMDLQPFGIKNANELFVPVDEPHGQIEATVTRD